MFCPKCGTQNPETGKFCRACGTDLGNVSEALTGNRSRSPQPLFNHKGKPVHWEGAIGKLFTGLAFLIIAVVLAFTGMGRGWWFWLLIPAFGSLGSGIAQYIQLKNSQPGNTAYTPQNQQNVISSAPQNPSLPPTQTEYVSPDSRYKTGDLVPPSVTDGTTRHLEINSEGKTMTLPKK